MAELTKLVSKWESKKSDWSSAHKALQLIRKKKLNEPELVLQLGCNLITKHKGKIGNDIWYIYQDVFMAALICHQSDWVNYTCKQLERQFGDTHPIARLKGMTHECVGSFEKALSVYEGLIARNDQDLVSAKRKSVLFRTNGQPDRAVAELNAFLSKHPGEIDAWHELANIYQTMQQYTRAAFCYEELLLARPHDYWINLKYAEMLYSVGGLENLVNARKYLTHCIILNPTCPKAHWGLIQCCFAINRIRQDETSEKMIAKSKEKLTKLYERSPIELTFLI